MSRASDAIAFDTEMIVLKSCDKAPVSAQRELPFCEHDVARSIGNPTPFQDLALIL